VTLEIIFAGYFFTNITYLNFAVFAPHEKGSVLKTFRALFVNKLKLDKSNISFPRGRQFFYHFI
jgi:hypothetical protein